MRARATRACARSRRQATISMREWWFSGGTRSFFGDGAVHLLATLSSEKGGLFDRMQRAAFANPRRAARLYPVLAAGRRLFLRLVGRKPIGRLSEKRSSDRE